MTRYLHVTVDGKTPLCGRHKAHPNEEFIVSKKLSMDLCERLGVDLCDVCLYVMWRTNSHTDILEDMPKCRAGVMLWPAEESVYISCEIPKLLHEGVPEENRVHLDFHMGYWVGDDPESVVFT